MNGERRTFKMVAMLNTAELEAIDDWRRRQGHLMSRGEAVRRLLKAGIEATTARKSESAAA